MMSCPCYPKQQILQDGHTNLVVVFAFQPVTIIIFHDVTTKALLSEIQNASCICNS
jgi:hypothetical protein